MATKRYNLAQMLKEAAQEQKDARRAVVKVDRDQIARMVADRRGKKDGQS